MIKSPAHATSRCGRPRFAAGGLRSRSGAPQTPRVRDVLAVRSRQVHRLVRRLAGDPRVPVQARGGARYVDSNWRDLDIVAFWCRASTSGRPTSAPCTRRPATSPTGSTSARTAKPSVRRCACVRARPVAGCGHSHFSPACRHRSSALSSAVSGHSCIGRPGAPHDVEPRPAGDTCGGRGGRGLRWPA
jgi:hypothetical protein